MMQTIEETVRTLTEDEAAVIAPEVAELDRLTRAIQEQQRTVLRMAAMLEPRLLETGSGYSFNPQTRAILRTFAVEEPPAES